MLRLRRGEAAQEADDEQWRIPARGVPAGAMKAAARAGKSAAMTTHFILTFSFAELVGTKLRQAERGAKFHELIFQQQGRTRGTGNKRAVLNKKIKIRSVLISNDISNMVLDPKPARPKTPRQHCHYTEHSRCKPVCISSALDPPGRADPRVDAHDGDITHHDASTTARTRSRLPIAVEPCLLKYDSPLS